VEQRINAWEKGQDAVKSMFTVGTYLARSPIEPKLQHLVEMRVSQMNSCAYCLDMHSKDLRHEGETEQRLYSLEAWREAPFYTDRERAALAWAEALTSITDGHVPDEVYKQARSEFSEEELIDLSLAVVAVNSWNRLNIAFRTTPGTYVPGQWTATATGANN